MAVDSPRAALAGFALVVAVALLVAGSTSGAAFGAYNPAWDGTAEFRSLADETGTDQTVARNASAYRATEANGTLAVVLSPESAYDDGEADAVGQFVRDGGTLLVAEDVGPNGNRLLRDVGARARVDGATVRDERTYENGPALPVATVVGNGSYAAGVDSLVLNHGTSVDVGDANASGGDEPANATVLAETSPYAYRDANGNGALDDGETLASEPVAVVERVGEGRIIVVGDPSVFINTMLERGDNRQFARNLHASHDRVVLDVSHGGSVPPLRAAALTLRGSSLLQLAVGSVALALVVWRAPLLAGLGALRRRFGRDLPAERPLDRETVVRGVRARHPEWDADRVERVTQAIMDRRTEGGTDE